jgi:GPH family glycoside/pentoside/hexuronide:cation symporter
VAEPDRVSTFNEQIGRAVANADSLLAHLDYRLKTHPDQSEHIGTLIARTNSVRAQAETLRERGANLVKAPEQTVREADALLGETNLLKQQPPKTLFRLRLVEIGLPLAMSCISILLALRYPLTEARWREIKAALDRRHAGELNHTD